MYVRGVEVCFGGRRGGSMRSVLIWGLERMDRVVRLWLARLRGQEGVQSSIQTSKPVEESICGNGGNVIALQDMDRVTPELTKMYNLYMKLKMRELRKRGKLESPEVPD